MNLKFVNGYEQKYDIATTPMRMVLNHIRYVNHAIEMERSLNGQDDEMDDEM